MATGTLRFWAAARAAAGVAEEPYDAATLGEALAAARARHGAALASVLDRCSFVVDDAPVGTRTPDSVRLTEGGSIEALPPFAGGAARRLDATVEGLGAGLVAVALAGLTLVGIGALAAGVFVVQVAVAVAWLTASKVRGSGGGLVIAVAAAGVIDGVVGSESGPDIGRGAGVLGVAVVVGLLYQLVRRPRIEVTASFAGLVAVAAFALSAASYLALRVEAGGDKADVAALLGAGAALATGRLVDLALPRPAAAPGSRRGVVGVVAGIGIAVLVGWIYGRHEPILGGGTGLRMALVTALLAVAVDLALDAVLSAVKSTNARERSAIPPLGILLPVVLTAPAAYVTGRILLG